MLKTCLAALLGLFGLPAYAAQTITLTPAQAKRFDVAIVNGMPLLQHEKIVKMGQSLPPKGQVEISLAPGGHAAEMAKVHVFVRSATALGLHVTAYHGDASIASQDLCGGLELDSWTALPSQTTRVVISGLAEVKAGCP